MSSTSQQVVPPSLPEEENLDFLTLAPQLARKRRSQLQIIIDRFLRNRMAVVGMVVLALITLATIFAPFLTHASAAVPDPSTKLHLDNIFGAPSLRYPLGTDELGRDELARILYGGRVSLLVGSASMAVALVFGIGIGAIAGFYGGIIDNLLMRFTDVILAIPLYLLLFVLSASFSNGTILSVVFLIAIFGWTYTARLVRGEFLSLKEHEFVMAARTLGASNMRLMLRHILPNAAGPIIVNATLLVGQNIILESVLSFFGFGIRIPLASWGSMVATSRDYFLQDPLLVWAPGLCILIVVLSFNLMGDGLRDALDPYLTER
jgi:peptide/nickel transport system permease protein